MQALRLARPALRHLSQPAAGTAVGARASRGLATATLDAHSTGSSSTSTPSSSSTPPAKVAPIPVSNIEAQWSKLSQEERVSVHDQLEALQVKDWKELSVDEKKAAYYIAFGPHGPRAPTSKPGDNLKIFLYTVGLVGIGGLMFLGVKSLSPPPPKTMTKEWQEASNERALEKKINPITGISSEGYSGKGFVQSK